MLIIIATWMYEFPHELPNKRLDLKSRAQPANQKETFDSYATKL